MSLYKSTGEIFLTKFKRSYRSIFPDILYDLLLAPFAAAAALPMRLVRRMSTRRIPVTFWLLRHLGVFPLRNHYYEPLFDASSLRKENVPRDLPGISFDIDSQVALLKTFVHDDVMQLKLGRNGVGAFDFSNGNFGPGDAEIWFHVIRHFKPRRIVEIGSGYSTQMAKIAIDLNKFDDPSYACAHICIEPYEMPWLEDLGVHVIRKKLEDTDQSLFQDLEPNDILFIDSSHMIRPQGEVLLEILQILPCLKPGVIVHIHDIFTPRDYPMAWIEQPRFWNEQYLLEAFLTENKSWEILLALNMLKHERYSSLENVCLTLEKVHEPGSFYMCRISI